MALHYNNIVKDLSNIVPAIGYYEKELEDAKWEVKIKGSLEKASSSLPGLTEFRFNQLQEIEAILEHLNIELRKERSITFRKYLEHYNRTLSSRDAEKFVDNFDEALDSDTKVDAKKSANDDDEVGDVSDDFDDDFSWDEIEDL